MRRAALALAALSSVACPSSRDAGNGGAPLGSTPAVAKAPAPALVPSASVLASATPPPEGERIVPLVADEALAADSAVDGEANGFELLFQLRPLRAPNPPVHLGAVAHAIVATNAATVGVLRATVAGGRVRLRVGPRVFALDEGWELRANRERSGALLLLGGGPSPLYRVIPSGAMRAVLSERRIDVVPLGPTVVASLGSGTHLGRATSRERVTTAWGTLDLNQIAPSTTKPATIVKPDARPADAEAAESGLESGGEPLCRMLLELIAADRALGGAPCVAGFIPVRAEISFASGGGIAIEATSAREGTIARSELAFPPPGARLSTTPLPEQKPWFAGNESLLSLHAKGDPVLLELVNKTPLPRWILLDGAPIGAMPAGSERGVTVRTGRYVLEWRTPLGEIVERAAEVDAPARASAVQWVPPPLSSASPMASARNGP